MTTVQATTGVERIASAFGAARQQGRCALVTYLTAGYPSLAESPALLAALARGGADIIELGVPFSDPVADGPVLQAASQAALRGGVTPRACLDLVARARAVGLAAPVLLMGYYNPILAYGLAAYARDCAAAGVDGLIVPDLPPEEAAPLRAACAAHGLALVFLVAPTTAPARAAEIAAVTQGFLYVVSRLGTTGGELAVDDALRARLAALRRVARTPVAVGFGVSQPEQARALAALADGVIVGSAIVQRAPEGAASVQALVADLRAALAGS
ncbi:MAG: tryptophan synthase subunit alpha [Chloroflexota bacterium]